MYGRWKSSCGGAAYGISPCPVENPDVLLLGSGETVVDGIDDSGPIFWYASATTVAGDVP